MVWRYTFTCPSPESTLSLTAELRQAGLHASNQYWSLAEIWSGDTSHPDAYWFGRRVVNLWVDEWASPQNLERTAQVIAAWNSRLQVETPWNREAK